MLGTALAMHRVAVLGQQGLTAAEAAANFLPQTVTGIAATLISGALSDRIPQKYGVTIAVTTLARASRTSPPGCSVRWVAVR